MNNLSNIQNLHQLEAERRQLRKQIRRQENTIMNDLGSIQASAQKWVNGVFRVKNILSFFLPKVEIATVLFPVLKRIVRRKKR